MSASVEIFGLSGEAMAEVARLAVERVSANRLQQDLPVVVVQNGVRVREYPDGTLETLTDAPQGAE